MVQYQWEEFIDVKQAPSNWHTKFGPIVIKRDKNNITVKFQLLIDNPNTQVFLVGPFNDWGKKNLEEFEMTHDENDVFCFLETSKIKHKDPYKFFVNGKYIQDPAGVYFDDNGNSIFWDYDDSSTYKQKYTFIDTINRSTKIMQTDLPGLIVHWANEKGICGKDIPLKEYYKFIRESGIIAHMKSLGFNTIQFLPFAQSIDGDNWKFRYLVPFQFAIQKNWGDPDEFAKMIDEFHKHKIAVIGDFVLGHLASKDFQIFGEDCKFSGIHQWMNRHGTQLYMKEETSWGTMRVDFDNPYVRGFFISSCLHFQKQYQIDGFRIDNVDGIIRYGQNGEGDERPNGRTFLRELNSAIYEQNTHSLIHYEAHYFHEDNAKMLVIPMSDDSRALGATAYNSSRVTYYLHKEYMPKDIKKVTPWKFRDITEEKEWGQSNSTVADFHNHDAAAGLMAERCTGSYAYDTMTCKTPTNHLHALGKIKVMEGIISFMCEGRTLDLAQTFLLQTGTFEHDSSIQWFLTFNEVNRNTFAFKTAVNKLMDDPAFWPMFTKNRKFLNVDDMQKVLVIERSAVYKGKESKYVIIINLGAWVHHNYKVGVVGKKDFKVVLNSDKFAYAGQGLVSYPDTLQNNPSTSFEKLDREVELSTLAPYGIVVLKETQ